jgi:hypothetical protein
VGESIRTFRLKLDEDMHNPIFEKPQKPQNST